MITFLKFSRRINFLQALEISLLLGLMAKYSCENCELMLNYQGKVVRFEIENQATILGNLVTALDRVKVRLITFIICKEIRNSSNVHFAIFVFRSFFVLVP